VVALNPKLEVMVSQVAPRLFLASQQLSIIQTQPRILVAVVEVVATVAQLVAVALAAALLLVAVARAVVVALLELQDLRVLTVD
jgi:hypothetical protein